MGHEPEIRDAELKSLCCSAGPCPVAFEQGHAKPEICDSELQNPVAMASELGHAEPEICDSELQDPVRLRRPPNRATIGPEIEPGERVEHRAIFIWAPGPERVLSESLAELPRGVAELRPPSLAEMPRSLAPAAGLAQMLRSFRELRPQTSQSSGIRRRAS